MSVEEKIALRLRGLPVDKQVEVLDFIQFLEQRTGSTEPRKSLIGLCADLNLDITEHDIAEARREMWGNSPRCE